MQVATIERHGTVRSYAVSSGALRPIIAGPDGPDPPAWLVAESSVSSLQFGEVCADPGIENWRPVTVPSVVIGAEDNFSTQLHSRKSGLAAQRPEALERFRRADPAEDVWLIPRCPSSIARPGEPLRAGGSERLDVGATVAAVVGDAQDIAGYAVALDVVRRDVATEHAYLARSFPTHTHIGPILYSVDELASNAEISLEMNGERLQSDFLSNLVVTATELVACIRRRCALEPGDVVLLGTPPGTPFDRGGSWVQDGDIVTAWVEGLGEHRVRVAGD